MAGPLWRATAFVQRHRTALLVGSCAGLFGAQISYHLFPDRSVKLFYLECLKLLNIRLYIKKQTDSLTMLVLHVYKL